MNEEDVVFVRKKELLGKLFLEGFIAAYYSHKTLFEHLYAEDKIHKIPVALSYLSQAHNFFINAEIFLHENVSVLGERDEFDRLIHRFSVFNKELLDNARTDHSHQWTDIEFRAFVDAFKGVASLLSIDQEDFWIKSALKE